MNPPQATNAPSVNPSTLLLCMVVGLLCLIWGSTWVVIAGGLEDLPPFTGAAARFGLAALVLMVIAPALARREGGGAAPLHLVLTVGTLNFGVSYGIVYWSEQHLPSGLASVVWAVFPLMMGVGGSFCLPGERLRPVQWLGMLGGFLGVGVLFATDLSVTRQTLVAGGVLLLSPLAATLGTLQLKRHGAEVSSALLNRGAMAVGALLLGALALATERGAAVHWTPAAVGSVVYLALAGTVMTFGLYFWAMRYAPAYLLSLIAYLTPGIALLLGSVVRRESIGAGTLGGLALILGGVGAVFAGKRTAASPSRENA